MRILSLATGLVGCLLAASCNSPAQAETPAAPVRGDASTPAARAAWVEAATIERSSASLHLTLPGEVEGSKDAVLASSQGGYVEVARVEVGGRVKRGEVLFQVDRALFQARASEIEAEVQAAERELDRAKQLGTAISSAERDAARDRLIAAQAAARVAQIQVSRATIRAPFNGALAAVELEVGEVATPGAPAARLVVLDPVKVSISVADRDVGLLEPGTEVRVFVDALAEPRIGTIARILPAADIETRTFLVEVEVPNEDTALMPGMIARVEVEQGLRQDALLVPQGLLVTRRDATGVFVVEAVGEAAVETGVARWRPLKLGPLVRDQVVVEQGLRAGDNIVVVGQRALADGDSVILSRQGTCCRDGRLQFGGSPSETSEPDPTDAVVE